MPKKPIKTNLSINPAHKPVLTKLSKAIVDHSSTANSLVLSYTVSKLSEPYLEPYIPTTNYKLYNININSATLLKPIPTNILNAAICFSAEYILSKIDDVLAPKLQITKGIIPFAGRVIGMSLAGQITGYNPWFIGSLALASLISHDITSNPPPEINPKTIPQKVVASSIAASIGSAVKFTTRLAVSSLLNVQRPIFDALVSSIDKVTSKAGKIITKKILSPAPDDNTLTSAKPAPQPLVQQKKLIARKKINKSRRKPHYF